MTTPTPRTEAQHKEELLKGNTHPTGWSFARQLELAAKTAELEKAAGVVGAAIRKSEV